MPSSSFPTDFELPHLLRATLLQEMSAAVDIERMKLRGPLFLASRMLGNLEEVLRQQGQLEVIAPGNRWPFTNADDAALALEPLLEPLYDPRWEEGVLLDDPDPEVMLTHLQDVLAMRFAQPEPPPRS